MKFKRWLEAYRVKQVVVVVIFANFVCSFDCDCCYSTVSAAVVEMNE
jgi:hypothetical protein